MGKTVLGATHTARPIILATIKFFKPNQSEEEGTMRASRKASVGTCAPMGPAHGPVSKGPQYSLIALAAIDLPPLLWKPFSQISKSEAR